MPSAGPTYALANNDSWITLSDRKVAQSFIITGGNHGLYDFTVNLRKTGSPTGFLRAVIYDDDGTGKPGSPLENGISPTLIDASTISAVSSTSVFDFSAAPPFVLNGATYHIVFMNDDNWTGSNFLELGVDGSSPSYANANISTWTDGALVWTTDLTHDAGFTSRYSDVTPAAPDDGSVDLTWTCDCDAQDEVVEDNLALINAIRTVMVNLTIGKIEIYSPYFPSQGYWESEWLKQGNILPIPDGTRLLWYDTFNNRFGGNYEVVNGVVSTAITHLPKGSMYGLTRPSNLTNNNTALPATYAATVVGYEFLNTNILVPSKALFYSQFYVTGGPARWTYYLNGVNYYQTEFGTAGTQDGYENLQGGAVTYSPVFIKWIHTATLTPGVFTSIQIRLCRPAAAATWNIHYFPLSAVPAHNSSRMDFSYLLYIVI